MCAQQVIHRRYSYGSKNLNTCNYLRIKIITTDIHNLMNENTFLILNEDMTTMNFLSMHLM